MDEPYHGGTWKQNCASLLLSGPSATFARSTMSVVSNIQHTIKLFTNCSSVQKY